MQKPGRFARLSIISPIYSLFSEGPDHKRSLFNACHRERKDYHLVRPERF
jgi:hypothetical protein